MGKIILCGPSASGKDHARKVFEKKGFRLGVSYTTRDPRPGEIDGQDYYFISKREFEEMMVDDLWLEYDVVETKLPDGTVVENNYYGTTKQQFEDYDLFIMTPSGINKLPQEYKDRVVILNFDIEKELRVERMKKSRGWDENTIDARLNWEQKEFANSPADIRVKNPDF